MSDFMQGLDRRWRLERDPDRLTCELRFESFSEAFGFMTQVALLAEKLDHHPDWHNAYSRVVLSLRTHDAGGVTSRDAAFARRVDQILARYPPGSVGESVS